MTPLDRFMAKVEIQPGGCWLWTGARCEKGYALFQARARRSVKGHRWIWLMTREPIPSGLELDHLCRVRHCVNPEHLEPVTHRENVRRGNAPAAQNARKTHCVRGHELRLALGRPRRYCPICDAEAGRRAKRRRRTQRLHALTGGSARICAAADCAAVLPESSRLGTRFCSPACREREWRRGKKAGAA